MMTDPTPSTDPIDDDALTLVVSDMSAGDRLDRVLATAWPQFSRTRLKALIEAGEVTVDDQLVLDASHKVRAGAIITFTEPPAIDADPIPENIPLDIIYEDDDLLVINKDADMVVHPAPGHLTGTLVNAVLYHCGDRLSGIGGVKRPGIVHRLDRGTSGLMLVAKNDIAHIALQAQLSDRTLGRIYHCITFKAPMPPKGQIDAPIGRHPTHRLKMTIAGKDGRQALTHYQTLETYGNAAAYIECRLSTGRTHQIRVHMASMGHPLWGDPLYGAAATTIRAALKRDGFDSGQIEALLNFPRQALHAAEIHFVHPHTGTAHSYTAPAPDDFANLVEQLRVGA